MAWNPAADGWFSGFTDGEGCFYFSLEHRSGRIKRCQPEFAVGLRADDLAVLETLRHVFGGRLAYQENAGGANKGARKPRWNWNVRAKRDLAGLVAYFDAYPLRAKKAADYAIWRRAVVIYADRGGRAAELLGLREELMKGRAYGVGFEPVAAEPITQLRLVEGAGSNR